MHRWIPIIGASVADTAGSLCGGRSRSNSSGPLKGLPWIRR